MGGLSNGSDEQSADLDVRDADSLAGCRMSAFEDRNCRKVSASQNDGCLSSTGARCRVRERSPSRLLAVKTSNRLSRTIIEFTVCMTVHVSNPDL